jgi:methionine biosynthesis protein MetW
VEVAARLLPGGERLLDVGCGSGELEARLLGRYQKVVATDISPEALRTAEVRAKGAEFRTLDANQPLPFSDGEFDAITALSTLQYVFDPAAFLKEAHRVLRPSGTLILEVPNMAYLPQRLRLLVGKPIRTSFWKRGIDGGNLHYFTVDVLRELCEASGFSVEDVTGSGVFAELRTFWVSLLCGNIFILAHRR